MLAATGKELWVETRRLRFAGVETGTRMTIARLADGGLFVHSPVALDARTREAVDALGPVRAIVAPSRFHHLYVGQWARAYPDAPIYACPGLERKRPELPWRGVLGDEAAPEWRGELEQVFFSARSAIRAMTCVASTSRKMGRDSTVASATAPATPSRIMKAVTYSACVRASVTASVTASLLKPM